MKNKKEIEYASFTLTGVFDRNFKVLYADQPRLFRRLSAGSKKLLKKFRSKSSTSEINHFFQSEGINYHAFIKRLDNNSYICKISEELYDDEINNKEVFRFTDNVMKSSLNIQSLARMIKDYTERTKYSDDEFHTYLRRLKLENENLYCNCHTLVKAFDDECNAEFIPFLDYFLRTWDVVQYSTRKIKKPFNIYLDPIFPCVKIDYSKFELAFYNIVKLVLIYSIQEIPPAIEIKTTNLENIELSCTFPFRDDYSIENCDFEIRAVKHIFRKMGGHFEIYEDDGKLCIFGTLKTKFSYNTEDITPGRDIKFIATADELRKKLNSDRYIHIYENIKDKNKKYLASNVRELAVSDDSDILFAEMFFSKVLLCKADW